MLTSGEPIICPLCDRRTKIKHCSSPTCNWYACKQCVPVTIKRIIFDPVRNLRFNDRVG